MLRKKFALVGYSLSHTLSPIIHEQLFKDQGINGEYRVLDVHPNDLKNKIDILKSLDGYNVTIPYKQSIIPFIDRLSDKSSLYNSVNTVKNGSISIGYTTDSYGFLSAIKLADIPLKGKTLILGYGGVARVVAYESVLAGCDVTIVAREKSLKNAALLCGEIKNKFNNARVNCCCQENINGYFDLLVNATPVGMYPNILESPVSEKVLSRCAHVFDTIYNPSVTTLMKQALKCGCNVSGGLAMLICQAVQSQEIWNEIKISEDQIFNLILNLQKIV